LRITDHSGSGLAQVAIPHRAGLARVCPSLALPLPSHTGATAAVCIRPFPWQKTPRGSTPGSASDRLPVVTPVCANCGPPLDAQPRPHVAASFLLKNLLIPWQQGARWFWTPWWMPISPTTLSAAMDRRLRRRCRALLPHLQSREPGREVRPGGSYVRRWCPSCTAARQVDSPALASAADHAQRRRCRAGPHLSRPIVSHLVSREVALEAYRRITL